MGAPLTGEIDFPVGNRSYQLRLSIEEIIRVENKLDIGIVQIAASLSPGTVKAGVVRAMLWAALREKHPEIDIIEAGRLMVEVGVVPTVKYLGELMQAAFPTPAEGKETPSPRAGRAGTGKRSSSASSRSASTRKPSGD